MSSLVVDFEDRTDIFLVPSVTLAAAFLFYHSLLLSSGQLGKGFAQAQRKEAKVYDSSDHSSMNIPDREFHYDVSSYLVLFQNVFIFLLFFHIKAKESMRVCTVFLYFFFSLKKKAEREMTTFKRKMGLTGRLRRLLSSTRVQQPRYLTHLPGYASRSPSDGPVIKWHAIFCDCPQLPYAKQELITSIEKIHLCLSFQALIYTECFSGGISRGPGT